MVVKKLVSQLKAGDIIILKDFIPGKGFQKSQWVDQHCVLNSIDLEQEAESNAAVLKATFPSGQVKFQSWYLKEEIFVVE